MDPKVFVARSGLRGTLVPEVCKVCKVLWVHKVSAACKGHRASKVFEVRRESEANKAYKATLGQRVRRVSRVNRGFKARRAPKGSLA